MNQRIKTDAQIRSVNDETRTITIIASTFAKDSYNTRIDPNGWDLTQFESHNAPILWAHDDRGFTPSAGLPVGKAIKGSIRIQDGKLMMDVQFTSEDENPFGYRVYKLIKGGYLNMVSVGFEAQDWEDKEENGEKIRIYKTAKLLEVSIVAIGANDEALIVKKSAALNQNAEDAKALVADVEVMERAVRKILDDKFENYTMYKEYFERKKPVNRAAGRAMKKFFERVVGEEQPTDELEAFEKMELAIDQIQLRSEEEVDDETDEDETDQEEARAAETVTETMTTTIETKEEPTPTVEAQPQPAEPTMPSITPEQADPAPERTASVQVPLSLLKDLPGILARSYTESAIAALRQGITVRDANSLIDGLNETVINSFTLYGNSRENSRSQPSG